MSNLNEGDEIVKCDLCGSAEYDVIGQQTDIIHKVTDSMYSVVQCKICKLCYTNPRPKPTEISKYYADSYNFHQSQSLVRLYIGKILKYILNSKIGLIISWLPGNKRRLINYISPKVMDPVSEYIEKSKSKVSVLDIGCGNGQSANFWGVDGALYSYRKKADVCGVEIDDEARSLLKKDGIESYKDINDISSGKKFDVIRMNWSLEHAFSPSLYFEKLKSYISEKGIFVICVPNYDGILYKLNKLCVEVPVHFYHFDTETIRKYADKHGYKIKKLQTFSYTSMFVFAAEIGFSGFEGFEKLTLSEAIAFQKILEKTSGGDNGNDMVVVLELKSPHQ